jgi:hypothetical protein
MDFHIKPFVAMQQMKHFKFKPTDIQPNLLLGMFVFIITFEIYQRK